MKQQGESSSRGQQSKVPSVTKEMQQPRPVPPTSSYALSHSSSSSTSAPPTNLANRSNGPATSNSRPNLTAVTASSIIKPMGSRSLIRIVNEKNDLTITIRQDYIEKVGGDKMRERVKSAFGISSPSFPFEKFATVQQMHSLFFDRILDMKNGLGNCAVYAVVGESDSDKRTLEYISSLKVDVEPIFCLISTDWSYSPIRKPNAFFEALFLINNR